MHLKTNFQNSKARHHASIQQGALATYPKGFRILRGNEKPVHRSAYPLLEDHSRLIVSEILGKAAAFRPGIHLIAEVFLHRPKPDQILFPFLVRQALLVPVLNRRMHPMSL